MERRNTHQKQMILQAVKGRNIHRTAEEVLQIVREEDPRIGLATVYRNLNLFAQEGQIQKIEGNGWSFYDGNPEPHDHLHCIRCGRITDYPSSYDHKIDREAEKATGGRVICHMTVFEGVCSECMACEEENASPA